MPDNFKLANVIPVFKKGSQTCLTYYRLISLLSVFNKLLEKLMCNRLVDFLEKKKVFFDNQFSFRAKHSTDHAVLSIVEKIQRAIDERDFSCGIFLDFSKVFDTINHEILLKKLEFYGIRGIANQWFSSYLSNRMQTVTVNGVTSNSVNISCGVPQGSVLGPILFLLYINDFHHCSKVFDFHLFADDTNLFCKHKNLTSLQESINNELSNVNSWLCANKLSQYRKNHWTPCQVIEWLGIVWDSSHGTIRISDRGLSSKANCAQRMSQKGFKASARELPSLVGKIISARAVFGNISRIMTRYCSISVAAVQDWDSKFTLDQYCAREIEFWEINLDRLNLKSLVDFPFRPFKCVVYSDTNATGCSAHLNVNGEQICHKQRDVHKFGTISTWREFTAIVFALESFLPLLKGSYITRFSDSKNACRIIQVGSMRKDLHVIAFKISVLC